MAPLCLLWGWVLMAAVRTGATSNLVDQSPRWALIRRGQAETLHCFLRDSQYPWMSWYQQDLQGQLQILASLRFSRDKEAISLPGADYQATRVSDTELRLQVANVTQGRTLYCTCSSGQINYDLTFGPGTRLTVVGKAGVSKGSCGGGTLFPEKWVGRDYSVPRSWLRRHHPCVCEQVQKRVPTGHIHPATCGPLSTQS